MVLLMTELGTDLVIVFSSSFGTFCHYNLKPCTDMITMVDRYTTTEFNCRGGSRASVGAAALAALPRVFLQRVPL